MKHALALMMVLLMAAGMAFASGQTEGDEGAAPAGEHTRPNAERQQARRPMQTDRALDLAARVLERAEEVELTGSFALTRDIPTIVTDEGTFAVGGGGVRRYARLIEEGTELQLSGLLIRPLQDLPLVIDGQIHVTLAVIGGETFELSDEQAGFGRRMMGARSGPGRTGRQRL